jgi:SAM-dependent methyltransferase
MPFEPSSHDAQAASKVDTARPACPLCATPAAQSFFEQKGIPIHENVLMLSREEARACPRGDLAVALCSLCGQIFNAAFDYPGVRFSAEYNNAQTYSPRYLDYLEELASDLIQRHALRGKAIVEIGCGQGTLLLRLCRGGQNRGIGYDPSYGGPETAEGGMVRFSRDFFDEGDSPLAADLVVCRQVLDLVPQPRRLVAALSRRMAGSSNTTGSFEVPDVNWMLKNCVLWDMGYERRSYFSPQSLRWLFEHEGFEVTRLSSSFGGQYLWLEAHPAGGPRPPSAAPDLTGLTKQTQEFAVLARRKIAASLRSLQEAGTGGKCCVWGAGAKGVMFLNLLDPRRRLIHCAVDINPAKQGKFVPGTGHPIVSPESLRGLSIARIVLMNPIYFDETRQLLKELGISASLECA